MTRHPVKVELSTLIDRAQAGDKAAFRALYAQYVALVASRVMRLMGPGPDVDDVVQDVFLELYKSLPRFSLDRQFVSWLNGITRNVTLRHLNKRGRVADLSARVHLRASAEDWARLSARQKIRIVYAALEEAEPEHREAFLLHTFEGMSLQEIADSTGASINTVASRVRRLRGRLHSLMERSGQDQRASTGRAT